MRALIQSSRWEWTIAGLIVFNAAILGLMTSPTVMDAIGPALVALDLAVIAVFVVEIGLRLYVHRLKFFRDPWSIFDFVVVAIAVFPSQHGASVLRALRILRVLRLISVVPTLRRVVGGLIAALPGMGSIVLLMAIIFYVFAVMATNLYGQTFPDWFGTIGASAYTLFQIMTLESWSMGIVRPVMAEYPYAWAFFVPFIMATAFTVLNLFIGIIVSAMQQEHEATLDAERQLLHDEQASIAEEMRKLRGEIGELRGELRKATEDAGTSAG
ncbi:ion transporter [Amorphus orientalis]|uniref:Voltage-gated sodium channel n=1 Tax=Amorphus orientalis TaxID=649198 RepID=A0AAE3VKX8_9HYPH|nr:ion transporter [Amorphus orientalis]MDQ0313922.1 voltage-gated sodium channel [Amorphus orientalis]